MKRASLLNRSDAAALPKLYATENVPDASKIAQVKFFHPLGRGTWFAVEFDGEDVFFGYTVSPLGSDLDEWGYFSLAELQGVLVRGLAIERDLHFRPQPMREALPAVFGAEAA
jgi:hypothetical protein